jgi:DNA-binding transcriptional regulator YiaG
MEQLNIAELVSELRHQLDLSQEKFALRLGVSLRTVSRWENGQTKPSPLAMEKIANLQRQINGSRSVILHDRAKALAIAPSQGE